jgi:hypothetical protein
MVATARLATLAELQSVYSVADLYNLVEVAMVENYNKAVAAKAD